MRLGCNVEMAGVLWDERKSGTFRLGLKRVRT